MKHVKIATHLPLLYGALKVNMAAWNKFSSEIKTFKKNGFTDTDRKILEDAKNNLEQTHAVIVLIANCLTEALANYFLTNKCQGDKERFANLEGRSTYEKFVEVPKLFLKDYEFPENKLNSDLQQLLALRTSLVHSKPRVFVNGQVTQKGNLATRGQVSTLNAEKCASLPARLVAHIWKFDRGALAELWINSDFSNSVKHENSISQIKSSNQHLAK